MNLVSAGHRTCNVWWGEWHVIDNVPRNKTMCIKIQKQKTS